LTVCDCGEIVRLKSPIGSTRSVTEAVRVSTPLLAIIVRGYVPKGVLVEVEIERVVVPEAERLAGLNAALDETGKPLTLKFTFPTKPLLTVRAMV
jgi:hypothetical protein